MTPLIKLPGPSAKLSIGVMGGSFDPPHAGHAHVIETARKHLGLDWVWVLPAAGNPLKSTRTPFERRFLDAEAMLAGPRTRASAFEQQVGLSYSCDVIAALRSRAPSARFVWIIGADNLASFHRWKNWREIARAVPLAVISRPGAFPAAGLSRFARSFSRARIPQAQAQALPYLQPPAWTLIKAPHDPHSSTALRALQASEGS